MKNLINFWMLVFVAIVFEGCSHDVDNVLEGQVPLEMYADSVFLGFEGDLFYHEVIWGNVETYLAAYNRMKSHLKVKDERLAWDFECGADLNVSENIYEYVTGIWQRQNENLASGKYRLKILDDEYRVEPIESKEILLSRTGQFVIPGSHGHNMSLLMELYNLCASYSLGGRPLSEYIENLGDYSVFRPACYYVASNWSYWCENACFYIGNVSCDYNRIGYVDSEKRGGEIWRKILNHTGLPLVSLMTR